MKKYVPQEQILYFWSLQLLTTMRVSISHTLYDWHKENETLDTKPSMFLQILTFKTKQKKTTKKQFLCLSDSFLVHQAILKWRIKVCSAGNQFFPCRLDLIDKNCYCISWNSFCPCKCIYSPKQAENSYIREFTYNWCSNIWSKYII